MKAGLVQRKRSWNPYIMKSPAPSYMVGKWYTGHSQNSPAIDNTNYNLHEIRELSLKPTGLYIGHNCGNIHFEDEEHYSYQMTSEDGFKLILKMVNNELPLKNGYVQSKFVQIKRGSKVLIAEYAQEEDK